MATCAAPRSSSRDSSSSSSSSSTTTRGGAPAARSSSRGRTHRMRHFAHTIFNEFVPASTLTYTSTDNNPRMGAFDQLALHVVVDNVTGAGSLNIFVEHSGDARQWIQRNSMIQGSVAASAVGDI